MVSEQESDFYAGLARRRVGAGVLVTDAEGRVLIVEPTYKDHWEIPGGAVDAGESAVAACRRECQEELGLDLGVGRILVVDHQQDAGARSDSIMFVYDGGTIDDPTNIRLPDDELRSFRFVELDELEVLTTPRLARRVRFAVQALRSGELIELEDGVPTR